MDAIIYVLLVGMLGGVVRSIVNYKGKDESFDPGKFMKSAIRAAVGGLILAYTLNLDPIATFFAALSSDVIMHDAYKTISKK